MDPTTEIAWNTMIELRKEILEAQRIRAQVIGFKITFVSAAIGVIIANKVAAEILVIPAFAAVFFDLLINSYSVSIKRKGVYIRCCIEPKLKAYAGWPKGEPLWEEFMSRPESRQRLSIVGNLGLSALALGAAGVALVASNRPLRSLVLGGLLLGFFVTDLLAYLRPRQVAEGKVLVRYQGSVQPAPSTNDGKE